MVVEHQEHCDACLSVDYVSAPMVCIGLLIGTLVRASLTLALVVGSIVLTVLYVRYRAGSPQAMKINKKVKAFYFIAESTSETSGTLK